MSENKIKPFDYGLGIVAGLGTTNMIGRARIAINRKLVNGSIKSFEATDNDVFLKASDNAYKDNRLGIKKVKRVHIDDKNAQRVIDKMTSDYNAIIDKKIKIKSIAQKLKKRRANQAKAAVLSTASGKNGFYSSKYNAIHINKNKAASISFHELGHAINHNKGGITKLLQKCNVGRLFVPIFLAVGLLANKKEKPEKDIDKIDQFVKNNCGKLTFICMIPTLIEEALASVNAHRLAKPYLTKKQLSQLNKGNAKAWCTYLVGSTCTTLGAALAVYVRDKIVGTKAPKNQNTNIPNNSQYYYPQYKA